MTERRWKQRCQTAAFHRFLRNSTGLVHQKCLSPEFYGYLDLGHHDRRREALGIPRVVAQTHHSMEYLCHQTRRRLQGPAAYAAGLF